MATTQALLLWDTDVTVSSAGHAHVKARKPVLEGNVDRAREVLGGKDVVTRYDVYRLIKRGMITAWQLDKGVVRADKKKSNRKLIICLESVMRHRERMRAERSMPAPRVEQNVFVM